ncbi:heat-inducible transcriptional repressor HrcA [Solemya pervernicosa gill symbiont]|uniref:Heat-inducible transcription repressor HrcA n=2 Tax=Gammaproteobacteria incertae sedis TaxID=118884 RepID=A0A1T2L9I5_9GAMM|nr:heat-inducible transcriptional repressor HrcA [Solemya pervernicosa gill symbiont]QKQ28221.1 heat-inducible transcriptional repressor HrcA [Candidatus Reidiella endopervernicosa]
MSIALNERAQHLLKVLVEHYIEEGTPVGSRTLARDIGLKLSPATIRNVISDLEELGLVSSPHTSAGRIPTVQGYRMFVDSLLTVRELDTRELGQFQQLLDPKLDSQELLLNKASSLLSGVSQMAGVVTMPRLQTTILRQVEFLPLSDRRILVILVVNEHEVQNRIIHVDRDYSAENLRRFANYLSSHFAGQDVSQLHELMVAELESAREHMDEVMRSLIDAAGELFDAERNDNDFLLAGETNLMGLSDMSSVEKLRGLFEAFSQKQEILHLLDHSINADGVQIFIGEESGYSVLDECSVVTAPYNIEGQGVGVLGVIGPTRMAYERVIPIVDVTAKLLSAALNPRE